MEQQKALKKLLERSAARQSNGANTSETKLFLPFILVQVRRRQAGLIQRNAPAPPGCLTPACLQ